MTGTVPDVRPYLSVARVARVAVAPLLSGGGTRLKVLEALDVGRPVVATPISGGGGTVCMDVVLAPWMARVRSTGDTG